MKIITVLIAEDHAMVREAWQLFLQQDARFKVVGCCESGEEVIELALSRQPDVILMDINLKGMNGIEATPIILAASPDVKIIALSMHTEVAYVRRMMKSGAKGYMTKNSGAEELLRAICEVYENRKFICEETKQGLTADVMENNGRSKWSTLTNREVEVINHIKQGLSSKETALLLKLSAKTVDLYRYNILKKLQVRNTASLINYVNQEMGV